MALMASDLSSDWLRLVDGTAALPCPLVGGATACFLVPELLDLKEIGHHKSSPTQFIQILLHVHVHM